MEYTKSNIPSTPTARLVGHEGPILSLTFSHDGKYCLTGGYDRTVRLWNPTRVDPAYQPPPATTASSSSSGSSREKSTTRTIDESTPEALPIQSYTDGHTHPVSSIAIDDDNTTVASASHQTLIVTDVLTRKLKKRFTGHTGRINSVDCSIGAEIFTSGSYDGSVRLWDGRSFDMRPVMIFEDAKDSVSCVVNRQCKDKDNVVTEAQIYTTSVDGKLRTYDLRKGELRMDDFGSETSLNCLTFTHDASGESLCTVVSCLDGELHVVERLSGKLLQSMKGGHTGGRYALRCDVTADDEYVVSGSEDGNAVIYDFVSGRVVTKLCGHSRPTCAVACHPKKSIIITGSYDGRAVVWTNGDSNLVAA